MSRHGLAIMISALFIFCAMTFSASTAELKTPRTIRIGVASMVTPVSAVKYYQAIIDYLAERLGQPVEMVHRTTYDEIDRMLENGTVDAAFICSAPYVLDKRNFNVELLVVPVVNGKPLYRSNIIVHKSSAIQSIDELRHRVFAFVDPKSNTGRLYPVYLLARKGVSPDDFFSRYIFSYSHNKSVELVAGKKVDGAAVDSIVYQYMLATGSPYARQTKIIHQSPEFGMPPVVVPADLPLFLKQKLRQEFMHMHEKPAGRAILNGMHIDKFAVVADANYNSIREMMTFLDDFNQQQSRATDRKREALPKVEPIRFGLIPMVNPRIAYDRFQPLMDYLAEQTGTAFELVPGKTFPEVVNSLEQGTVDMALLGPLSYLDAYARFGATVIARSINKRREPFYRSVIFCRADSGLRDLSRLVGKKMAFGAIWSTSGNLYPRYMLAWQNIHLGKLATYSNFHYPETVVKKVISGEYDAGATTESVIRPYLRGGLKIIATSDPIPTSPIVIGPGTAYTTVEKIKHVLFGMNQSQDGLRILKKLGHDFGGGFVPASDADYGGIRKMINDVPLGCGVRCHPQTRF